MRIVIGLVVLGFALTSNGVAADKKKEKNPLEGKKGTVIGTLSAKDKTWIEVKADGEEKARRYVPHWVGGAPAQGGGPDKNMLKIFSELKVGSRIELQWEFEERLRAVKVKVLKTSGKDEKKAEEKRTGKSVGTLTAREDGKWIELKADGEEKARKYHVHAKLPEKLLLSVKQAPIGSRVSVEWIFTNHGPIVQGIEVLRKTTTP